MLTLRDRPFTPDKSKQKQSSSAKWARIEEQSAIFILPIYDSLLIVEVHELVFYRRVQVQCSLFSWSTLEESITTLKPLLGYHRQIMHITAQNTILYCRPYCL